MKQERPVFISVTKYRFPITAIVSVLHRISGFLLFLLLPLLVYILHGSLLSQNTFFMTQTFIADPWIKFFLWVALACVSYHFVAGIRHLMMDLGWFESKIAGHTTSYLVLIITLVLVVLAGVWIW